MEKRQTMFLLTGIFVATQILGLYVGGRYISLIRAGQAAPVFENPESVENSLQLVFWILVATGAIMLIIRFRKVLIRFVEVFAVFFASMITFELLIPSELLFPAGFPLFPLALFLSSVLVAWKMLRPSIASQNMAMMFSIAGIGALMGASLGVLPLLVFIVLLSIYDFIAVFVTKHMVYIAKEIAKRPTAFTAAMPAKFKKPVQFIIGKKKVRKRVHVFQLGGGDMAIPLMLSVSVLSEYTWQHALLTVLGSAFALSFLFYYVLKKPQALPALPWISSGTILGFIISTVIL